VSVVRHRAADVKRETLADVAIVRRDAFELPDDDDAAAWEEKQKGRFRGLSDVACTLFGYEQGSVVAVGATVDVDTGVVVSVAVAVSVAVVVLLFVAVAVDAQTVTW